MLRLAVSLGVPKLIWAKVFSVAMAMEVPQKESATSGTNRGDILKASHTVRSRVISSHHPEPGADHPGDGRLPFIPCDGDTLSFSGAD